MVLGFIGADDVVTSDSFFTRGGGTEVDPRFVFFAKGSDAKHLSVVALDDGVFSTLFRARAVLAQMTSNMRNNDFFRQQELQHVATFFDLLQLMEFDTLVISDGETWSHQVNFVR